MKKLIPIVAMFLVVSSMLGTSTFAWFSMNTKVSVTGMEVKTSVGNNLMVAEIAADANELPAAANFKAAYIKSDIAPVQIEPASSINGMDFYYTKGTNVLATGDASEDEYLAYNAAAFNTNYGTTGAVAYVDYVVCLKASNTSDAAVKLALSKANITYNGAIASEKAFRAAVITEKWTGAAFGEKTNLTVLAPESAAYFTPTKAVSGVAALDSVANFGTAALIGSVDAKTTDYYRVTVRLWLEGEDTTCNNDTFVNLTGVWGLDLDFDFTADAAGVTVLGYAAGTPFSIACGTAKGAELKTINGESYYKYTGKDSSDGDVVVYCKDAAITTNSKFFTIDENRAYNVTHLAKVYTTVTLKAGETGLDVSGASEKKVGVGDKIAVTGITTGYTFSGNTNTYTAIDGYVVVTAISSATDDNVTLVAPVAAP